MSWKCLFCSLFLPTALRPLPQARGNPASDGITIPWSTQTFKAMEDCVQRSGGWHPTLLKMNAHFIAPPAAGVSWEDWIGELKRYRQWTRDHLFDQDQSLIRMDFKGVRAWIRLDPSIAFASDLKPGERIRLHGEARWEAGNHRLCMALDYCDRSRGQDGPWLGWSGVIANVAIPKTGAWAPFALEATLPQWNEATQWARPLFGMDATFDPTPGVMELRQLRLILPRTDQRDASCRALIQASKRPPSFDDSQYRRQDLAWGTRNFVVGFVMVYDRDFWDPDAQTYRISSLCDEADRQFGGFDSVILWHAYPRIGTDERNQFDFFRDMPGGLDGLRDVVDQLHRRGIKVFLPYNPWDIGTRREAQSDEATLAEILAATDSDGLFLDTMTESTAGLRPAVDRLRPGILFEPEIHPAMEEMERCNGSWAQGLEAFPDIGVLHLKWIEPRHMQHQIRRWDASHAEELSAAWLNGSGILVWENVFGTWNPWRVQDRAALRRMSPILREYADLLSGGEWRPYPATLVPGVLAGHWQGKGIRLWTLVNRTGHPLTEPLLDVACHRQERFYDLWNGTLIEPTREHGRARLAVPLAEFGAILSLRDSDSASDDLDRFLRAQSAEAARPGDSPEQDPHVKILPVVAAKPPPEIDPGRIKVADQDRMISVRGGQKSFDVRHFQRECGCYPDPGVPESEWGRFLLGPLHGTLEHRVIATIQDFRIDPRPVTHGEFARFLKESGYRPADPTNFLALWQGDECPTAIAAEPVAHVDLQDARAFAAWAGKRLPTEWEWQLAASELGQAFLWGQVWEWTESERDDGHTRYVMLRGGSRYRAQGSLWYFPGGEQSLDTHAKFLLMHPGLDRCATVGFRCVRPE